MTYDVLGEGYSTRDNKVRKLVDEYRAILADPRMSAIAEPPTLSVMMTGLGLDDRQKRSADENLQRCSPPTRGKRAASG